MSASSRMNRTIARRRSSELSRPPSTDTLTTCGRGRGNGALFAPSAFAGLCPTFGRRRLATEIASVVGASPPSSISTLQSTRFSLV
jgi:hypothetical protein